MRRFVFILPALYCAFYALISFPKDTAAEQIEALHDEKYVTDHFWFHNALLACLAVTAFNLPKDEGGNKAKAK